MTASRPIRQLAGAGRLWPLVAGAGALAATAGLSGEHGPVLCPFRLCTGGYCPACGMTRAAGRLLRGDVPGSWHQHPFLVLALVQAVAVLLVRAALGSRSARWAGLWARRDRLAVLNLGLLLGIWLVRLVIGDVPPPFA